MPPRPGSGKGCLLAARNRAWRSRCRHRRQVLPPRFCSVCCAACCTTSCGCGASSLGSMCAARVASVISCVCLRSRSAISSFGSVRRCSRVSSSLSRGTVARAALRSAGRFAVSLPIITRSGGCSLRRYPPPRGSCALACAPHAAWRQSRFSVFGVCFARRHKKSQNLLQAARALGIIEKESENARDSVARGCGDAAMSA